jgi:hypothetical protein
MPYRAYGDWGALWYPYAEWREPHSGWVTHDRSRVGFQSALRDPIPRYETS